jgi:DHA2 family multidrug resistance protein
MAQGEGVRCRRIDRPRTEIMSPSDPGLPSANRWLIAIAVMSSAVMEVLDTSVVNVSLPHIAGSMSASVDEATWVLTSYLIANAVILPISGWLARALLFIM